jgi:hypothetical protein
MRNEEKAVMKLSEIMRMVFEDAQERLKAEHLAAVSKTRDPLIARGIRIRQYGKIEIRMPKRANSDPVLDLIYCTHMGDPANARYLFPLENEADEEMAWVMAEAIYDSRADDFSDDITEAECDHVFEQCLIDCRRMMCDPDYVRMFELMDSAAFRRGDFK